MLGACLVLSVMIRFTLESKTCEQRKKKAGPLNSMKYWLINDGILMSMVYEIIPI